MSLGNSRAITSNQTGIHDDLEKVVGRHINSEFKKPIAAFSQTAFDELNKQVQAFLASSPHGKVILDSCCGVGESSYHHAKANPNALVIGIDKSEHRIDKHEHHKHSQVENCLLVRGDLNDLWRMIADANWPISTHYLLYPNPWPKSKHLQRRWHGAPVFKYLPKIGERLVVRSNWPVYIQEFEVALKLLGVDAKVAEYRADEAMTPFERKYWASGQSSWQLVAKFR